MKKSTSIKTKLLKAMITVVLVQSCIYIIFVFGSGAIKNIETNAYNNIAATSLTRKNTVESMLSRYKNSLDTFEKEFNKNIQTRAKDLGIDLMSSLTSEQTSELLHPFADELLTLTKNSNVNGGFIILDGNGAIEKPALYFRRLDISSISLDNSDIIAEYGLSSIMKDYNITLDSHWTPYVDLNMMDYQDFYTKPFSVVKEYPGLKSSQYGYWSKKFSLSPTDIDIFTYSLPLIDSAGNVYGVVGIEVSTSLLAQSMSYDDLSVDEMGGYLIAVNSREEDSQYGIEFINSPYLKAVLNDSDLTLNMMENVPDMANVSAQGVNESLVAGVHRINIYEKNGPFSSDQWYLVGVVSKNNLLSMVYTMDKAILLSFVTAIMVSVGIALLSSSNISKAMLRVMKRLKESNPASKIELEKVNINEIDELSSAIEKLSADVAFNASRLSKIFESIDFPLAAIEYKDSENSIYCSDSLVTLLGMPKDINLASLDEVSTFFEGFYDKIIENEYDEGTFTCLVPFEDTNKWFRFVLNESDDRLLVIVTEVTKEKLEMQKMAYERDYDVLTNLLNRRAFKEKAMAIIMDDYPVIACVLWDLDNLKYVNDTYGHDFGDLYIQQSAQVLSTIEIGKAIISRQSGDEFIGLFYGYETSEEALNEIKRVHGTLSKTRIQFPDQSSMRLRASAGISWYHEDAYTYDQMIKHADFAMYDAKRRQKGIVVAFNEDSYERDKILLNDTELLNQMLETMAVRYAFQPIVSLKTGEVYAYEGLMRPQIPNLKDPSDVMRLAKSQSKLYYIEQMTWYRVLEDYSAQISSDMPYKLFVNSVPNTSLSAVDMNHIQETYGAYLKSIVVEMIESEQSDLGRFETKVDQLTRWQAELAIDDFGTGYSSETTVLTMNPAYVKIDISLINNIDKDKDKQLMVKSFLAYTKAKGIKVIGEGVERPEELKTLIDLDLDFVQGFYVAEPDYTIKDINEEIKKEILSYHQKN